MTREKPDNATYWSTRTLAETLNTPHSFVHRVWQSVGLKPHLEKIFKVSNDPHFEEMLCDVVGLFLKPPENAVVFKEFLKLGHYTSIVFLLLVSAVGWSRASGVGMLLRLFAVSGEFRASANL